MRTLNRVASFSAGTMVGELAFIDGERRSASVVAQADVECYVCEAEDVLRLQESHPRIHAKLLRNISASLAAKLRRANHSVSVLFGADAVTARRLTTPSAECGGGGVIARDPPGV